MQITLVKVGSRQTCSKELSNFTMGKYLFQFLWQSQVLRKEFKAETREIL